jgi:hypothetical protein
MKRGSGEAKRELYANKRIQRSVKKDALSNAHRYAVTLNTQAEVGEFEG